MRSLLQRIWLVLVASVFFLARIMGKSCNVLPVAVPSCAVRLQRSTHGTTSCLTSCAVRRSLGW
jgi:hypothetical protein